jgi:hypothetical protein
LTVAATYFIAAAGGLIMVHGGNDFALARRDRIVAAAQSSAILVANRAGHRLQAALLDFGSNLVLGGVTSTLTGLAIVGPYPVALYRGWVGGIVSVNNQHQSRLSKARAAVYYLVTLVLQLIPYSLAGGAGVALGVRTWRAQSTRISKSWFTLPKPALLDVLRIYQLIVPLFLIASLWEFLAP